MQTIYNWEKRTGRTLHYLQVTTEQVTVGSNDGSKESDMAGSCSLDDFVMGGYQDLIRRTFGEEVLQEVLAVVTHFRAGCSPDKGPE